MSQNSLRNSLAGAASGPQGRAAPPAQPNRMTLGSIRTERSKAPDRIFLVGTEGIGKTTFGANAPAPIFIAAEDGIRHLDVAHFPEPRTFQDVLDAVSTLGVEEHSYKTVVLDTVDWIEPLVWGDLCRRNGWDTIEAPGYGKGYAVALDEWRKLIVCLDALRRSRNMEVILLAHASIKPFQNPAGPDYSRFECKLHKLAAALLREWADTCLFAMYEEYTQKAKGETRIKAIATGARVMQTQRTAAWDAKNRWGLPPELPLNYADYAAARDAGVPADPAKLYAEGSELATVINVPDEERTKITVALDRFKGDANQLAQIVNRLRALSAQAASQEA